AQRQSPQSKFDWKFLLVHGQERQVLPIKLAGLDDRSRELSVAEADANRLPGADHVSRGDHETLPQVNPVPGPRRLRVDDDVNRINAQRVVCGVRLSRGDRWQNRNGDEKTDREV